MRRRLFRTLLAVLVVTVTSHPAAWANKATVFAYTEGADLVVEGSFAGGRACKGCEVRVYDASSGAELASGLTGDDGIWRAPLPDGADQARHGMSIVLVAGEGHQGEWRMEASEYLAEAESAHVAAQPEPIAATPTMALGMAPAGQADAAPAGGDGTIRLTPEELQTLVRDAVDRELAPVKRMLLEDKGPSLTDVLGGIGWLLGLAGLAAWLRSRNRR